MLEYLLAGLLIVVSVAAILDKARYPGRCLMCRKVGTCAPDCPIEDVTHTGECCPFCQYRMLDLWDYNWGIRDVIYAMCPKCKKSIDIHRESKVYYYVTAGKSE